MSEQPSPQSDHAREEPPGEKAHHQVVVVGPDGQPVGVVSLPEQPEEGAGERSVAEMVEQPAKVMRVGSMIKQLLEEARGAPLDEAARARLRDIHQRSIVELESGLAPELVEELERLSLPFDEGHTPTEAELRVAQAQLVGWLEGLFHGIQTALFAQQMSARAQFEEMRRRALPGGPAGHPGAGDPHNPAPGTEGDRSGPYL